MPAAETPTTDVTSAAGAAFRAPKTAELVANHLRKQIVRGELAAGESLPSETALTERFGVSRPTLREAFRVLENEQLITVRRGARGGANVHAPSAAMAARYAGFFLEHAGTTLRDVCDARVAIEAPAAGMAARRRTDEDLARLGDVAAHSERAGDRRERAMRFSELHSLVVEIARNQTLVLLHTMVQEIIDMAKMRRVSRNGDQLLAKGVKAHRKLITLIEAGDADAAEAFWRKHLVEANRYLLAGGDRPLDLLD